MRKIIVGDDVYEVDCCHHCGNDTLSLTKGSTPWDDIHYWYCDSCDSTYSLDNETICIKV
jgi:hypothetical protein